MFSEDKNLLVIPVTYYEPTAVINEYGYSDYKYFMGAFVFDIDLNGIKLAAEIEHANNQSDPRYYQSNVRRSLYMDDILYTISNSKIKANDLQSLDEVSEVEFNYSEIYYAESRLE